MKKTPEMPLQYNPYRLFAYNLSRLLKDRGLSQYQAAEKFGVCAAATINLWANGHRLPGAESLSRVAEVLDVPIAELFFDPQSTPTGLPGVDTSTPVLATTDSAQNIKNAIALHLRRHKTQSFGVRVTHPFSQKCPIFSMNDILICSSPHMLEPSRMALYDSNGRLLVMRAYMADKDSKNLVLAPAHACFGSDSVFVRSSDPASQSRILCVVNSVWHNL